MNLLLPLSQKEAQAVDLTGGKGANLSRLLELPGIRVPDGFVVTTEAFRSLCMPVVEPYLEKLDAVHTPQEIAEVGAAIRQAIGNVVMPAEFAQALEDTLRPFGGDAQFAVRSSATAEDLPDASFAGQQDSFLNVKAADVPRAVLDCFASLYNDRAIAYRTKNGYDHADVAIAVVVQRMVSSRVSGVLFTADPMTSDRFTAVIEAVEGLGEELVSGRKTPHIWRLREGKIKGDGKGNPPLNDQQLKELAAMLHRSMIRKTAP